MPKQKDLKRLARTRMDKTGESYTAARARLLAKKDRRAAPPAADPATYPTLAGMSDATIEKRTGRDWRGWVETLDAAGAAAWPHGEIAAHVHEKLGIPGWWSQTVAVGYERIKGLREIGQRRGGAIAHKKLASGQDAEARKAYWGERLTVLAEVVREAAGG